MPGLDDRAEMMTDDEVAAVHEAAHAVFAVLGEWTKLAGPVVLKGSGCGDVVMSTDAEPIRRTLAADPGFDRDLPRIELVRLLLAGPIAERILIDRGRASVSEDVFADSCRGDYGVIAEQLGHLNPPRPGLLEELEREVRRGLEQPAIWAAVERFAAILLERRRLGAEEASAMVEEILVALGLRAPAAGAGMWPTWAVGFVLLAATAIGPIWLMSGTPAALRLAGFAAVILAGALLSTRPGAKPPPPA